jgi:hypothetical protein
LLTDVAVYAGSTILKNVSSASEISWIEDPWVF